jgi:hypothetical protein
VTSRFVDLITFHGLRATTAYNARGLIWHELGGVNQLELQCDLLIDPITNLSSDRTPSYPGHAAPPMRQLTSLNILLYADMRRANDHPQIKMKYLWFRRRDLTIGLRIIVPQAKSFFSSDLFAPYKLNTPRVA